MLVDGLPMTQLIGQLDAFWEDFLRERNGVARSRHDELPIAWVLSGQVRPKARMVGCMSYICGLTRSIGPPYYHQITVSITKITSENPYVNMPEVYAAPPDYAFPRNFKGYGEKGLEGLKWPNDAKIAVSFVINYEEVSRAASADRISSRH